MIVVLPSHSIFLYFILFVSRRRTCINDVTVVIDVVFNSDTNGVKIVVVSNMVIIGSHDTSFGVRQICYSMG